MTLSEKINQEPEEAFGLAKEYGLGSKAPVNPLHEKYLETKGIKPAESDIVRYGEFKGISVVIIPYQNPAGEIASLQYISPDGKKLYAEGSKSSGAFCPIIPIESGRQILLTEGWATGHSLQQIAPDVFEGACVVSCGSVSNIPLIAEVLREKYPEKEIIIAPDRPKSYAPSDPVNIAVEKCKALGIGCVIYPLKMEKGDDWNDAVQAFSVEEITEDINAQLQEAEIAKNENVTDVFEEKRDKQSPEIKREKKKAEPFPFECLPGVFVDYARELAKGLQVADSIVGASFISLFSLLTQDIGDVKTDFGNLPLSIFSLIVAESGERKSTVDKFVFRPVRQKEKELFEEYKDLFELYKTKERVWKNEMDAMIKAKAGEDKLLGMQKQKPKEPTHPKILMQDPTIEGIYKQFHRGRRSLGLFSEEGGKMLGGYSMGKDREVASASSMSNFWDGKPLERTRATDDNTMETLFDRRLAVCLMVQPVIFEKAWESILLQQQGFLPRFLICMPDPKAGTRSYLDKKTIYFEHQQEAVRRNHHLLRVLRQTDESRKPQRLFRTFRGKCFYGIIFSRYILLRLDRVEKLYKKLFSVVGYQYLPRLLFIFLPAPLLV